MEDTVRRVLAAFGLRCAYIRKDKAAFLCGTGERTVRVERAEQAASRIWARHRLKQRLAGAGCLVDTYYETQSGEPYVSIGDDTYTVADAPKGAELDFADVGQLRRALAAVARMHAAISNVQDAALPAGPAVDVEAAYSAGMAAFSRYRKLIDKNRPYSDFDVAFLNKRAFYEQALADWRAFAKSQPPAPRGAVCHNALKEEYVLLGAREVYIIGFREAGFAPQTDDLAELLTRHLRSSDGERLGFAEAVAVYGAHSPMDDAAKARLAARMLYPDRFLELCARYYEKRRSWIPAAFGERLASVTKTDEAGRAYIKEYISV